MKIAVISLVVTAAALAQGPVKITKVPPPARALVFEVALPAPLDDVWSAFTTSGGLSTWLTPGAVVELRNGGEWTAHFPGGGTGGVDPVDEADILRAGLPLEEHVVDDNDVVRLRADVDGARNCMVT